jgi:hypothetical protein
VQSSGPNEVSKDAKEGAERLTAPVGPLRRRFNTSEYSEYSDKWKMSWVVPYLLESYFGNKPTSNKNLSEAFWRLMGKNVEIGGKKRWTDGKRGVPYHIHRLTNEYILAEVHTEDHSTDREYPEYMNCYVLGTQGQNEIGFFLKQFPRDLIDKEISKYVGLPFGK